MPSILMMLPLGAAFNPLYIGLVAGLGGAIGEMTAYVIGYTGRGIWNDNPNYIKSYRMVEKVGYAHCVPFFRDPDAARSYGDRCRHPAFARLEILPPLLVGENHQIYHPGLCRILGMGRFYQKSKSAGIIINYHDCCFDRVMGVLAIGAGTGKFNLG
jgi:hypothetical protein